jgi:hypothetical protein
VGRSDARNGRIFSRNRSILLLLLKCRHKPLTSSLVPSLAERRLALDILPFQKTGYQSGRSGGCLISYELSSISLVLKFAALYLVGISNMVPVSRSSGHVLFFETSRYQRWTETSHGYLYIF